MSYRSIAFLTLVVLSTPACVSWGSRALVAERVDLALAGDHRTAEERARDRYRHPRETLLFFGLRSNQTVVEILPIGGWYTKIIAPVLHDKGLYIAALPPVVPGNANSENGRKAFTALLASAPELFDRVQVTDWTAGGGLQLPAGSVDLVLTFRNIHNWMETDSAEAAFRDMYRVLKPGGTLGVVEHRGLESVPQDPRAATGYVNQSVAIRLIESAGFRLVGASEVNANPKDTKDYPDGVWTLPPTLSQGATDQARYLAIGESDRFTLKFVKPR